MKKSLLTIALVLSSSIAFADNNHEMMDHQTMNNQTMDMSSMDHSQMDHSQMTESKTTMQGMDHSNMAMENMSDVGMPAKGAAPDKVIQVILADDMSMTFKGNTEIKPNDIVQFVVMNTGKIDHEFAIGSHVEQQKHREEMKSGQAHHDHGSMGNVVTVKPGKAKQLTWHFHGDSKIEFACNIPGHAEAGMIKKMTLK